MCVFEDHLKYKFILSFRGIVPEGFMRNNLIENNNVNQIFFFFCNVLTKVIGPITMCSFILSNLLGNFKKK